MIRPRLYLFNTNTGRWHQLQNYLLWNDLLKAKPKRRVHGGVCGFTGIKLSNVGDSYLWNITSHICRIGLVWIWLLTTNKVCSSQHNVLSFRVFFIQSRRIDHKRGKILSGGRFKNTYELLNLRALKSSPVNKIYIFQCMRKIFCVEFQRVPLKFHTKYLTHTLRDTISTQSWNFKSS